MKNRLFALSIAVLTVAVIMNGCKKNGNMPNNDVYVASMDYNFKSDDIAESEDGFYFIKHAQNGVYLYYADKATMKPIILCNNPECLHERESGETAENCNAWLPNINGLHFHDGALYTIIQRDKKQGDLWPTSYLLKISKDGTSRQELIDFGENLEIAPYIIHRGYLYYRCLENVGLYGDEKTENLLRTYSLLKRDLKKPKAKPETIYENTAQMGGIHTLTAFGNNVYFQEIGTTDTSASTIETNADAAIDNVYRYDVKTKTCEQIMKKEGTLKTLFLFDSKLLANYWNYDLTYTDSSLLQMYQLNLDGSHEKEFVKRPEQGTTYTSGDYLFFLNDIAVLREIATEPKIYVYDKAGTLVDTLTRQKLGLPQNVDFYIWAADGDNIIIQYDDEKERYLKYFPKSELGSSSIALKDFFMFDVYQ